MIENTILSGLTQNEDYARKVLPFLREEYFDHHSEKKLFEISRDYITKYNSIPTKQALQINVENDDSLNQETYTELTNLIENLEFDPKTNEDWIIDETEKFCQEKAVYNAVKRSIMILDGEEKGSDKGAIPQILSDALGVSFDNSVGHDYTDQYQERFDFYNTREDRIPFDLSLLNKITKGGVARKSLCIALAGTGVGKTLFMTHCASANLMAGLNVLYITMEMAEEKISERIDANLLDVTIDELKRMPFEKFEKRIKRVKSNTTGKLIVKEYPTASASANHFRFLLNELKMKKNFVPDIVYIDYLNICMSARIKHGANVNSYTYIKSVAEELRGLAVEFNVPIFSATQTTRSGYGSTDVGLEDTSESFGLPATADFMLALMSSEELEEMGQIMVKQLKNRWGDLNYYKRFVLGIDRSKMRLYDTEDTAQDGITDSGAVADNTASYERFENEKKQGKPDFGGFM